MLVVGMGGGCDVISAYALGRLLGDRGAERVAYANTKTSKPVGMEPLSSHVYSFRARHDAPYKCVEEMVPRDPSGSPLLVYFPKSLPPRDLAAEYEELGFDLVVGVDNGGDCLVEGALSGPNGRDKRTWRVLEACSVPTLAFVFGPCSDGESTFEQFLASFLEQREKGAYFGCFSLRPLLPVMARLAGGLSSSRTPNIIAQAAGHLPCNWPEGFGHVAAGKFRVIRGVNPEVPVEWITRAFAFSPAASGAPQNSAPSG